MWAAEAAVRYRNNDMLEKRRIVVRLRTWSLLLPSYRALACMASGDESRVIGNLAPE